jgi:hypothetical protein
VLVVVLICAAVELADTRLLELIEEDDDVDPREVVGKLTGEVELPEGDVIVLEAEADGELREVVVRYDVITELTEELVVKLVVVEGLTEITAAGLDESVDKLELEPYVPAATVSARVYINRKLVNKALLVVKYCNKWFSVV